MIDLAPDRLSHEAHDHSDQDPKITARVEKNWYKMRRLAAKWKPRDYAIQFVRSHLFSGWSPESILDMDGCSSHAYASVCCGPTCAGLPKGKLKVKVWNAPEQIFSMREILEEVQKSKVQRSLFNV